MLDMGRLEQGLRDARQAIDLPRASDNTAARPCPASTPEIDFRRPQARRGRAEAIRRMDEGGGGMDGAAPLGAA